MVNQKNRVTVSDITLDWDLETGTFSFEKLPVAMMWIDSTLAGLMAGVQTMVGTERFGLALQSEGRNSVEADWQVISKFPCFEEGFQAISTMAAVAGWGKWEILSINFTNKECVFRVKDSWEGKYQKTLGVCWGCGMLAGKMAGYCSKLFEANCWAEQTSFASQGDEYDIFHVKISEKTIEKEIDNLHMSDDATKADLVVALKKLHIEIQTRTKAEEKLIKSQQELELRVDERTKKIEEVTRQLHLKIFEYENTNKLLQESETRFREMFEHMSNCVAIYQAVDNGNDFIFTDFNKAAEKAEGIKREDLLGKSVLKVFPGVKELGLFDVFQKVWRNATPVHTPSSFYHDKRLVGWRENYVYKLPAGEIVAIYDDVTAEKQAEQALKESEKKYRLLADNAVDVIWTMDTEQNITYISPSVEQLRGYTPEEAITESLEEKFTPSSLKKMREVLVRKNPANKPIIFEGEMRCKDGSTIWVEMIIRNLLDDSGDINGLIGVSRNIMKRKQYEEGKKELEKQLQQIQRIESIGTLAGGIAHDFNNILSSILGYSELVRSDLAPDSDTCEMQEQVIKAAKRAKDLVKQILLFSRQADQERIPVQPHLIIKEALKLLRSSLPTTIEIKQHIPTDCGSILADPTQIHQIIMNLCTNSYHAMREKGGVLTVSLSRTNNNNADMSLDTIGMNPGNYIKLVVADTGHGMDQLALDIMFDPYFTTKTKGEGTGLGLSVVYGIIKNLGGYIKVYSGPEKGMITNCYFPRLVGDANAVEELQKRPLPTGKERILIVDDETSILRSTRKNLEKLGYKVTTFSHGHKALKAFQAHPEDFDLVVTDLTMPHMTGIELSKRLLAIRPELPVIMWTGFSELISKEEAYTIGVKEFLTKPILITELAEIIRNRLD